MLRNTETETVRISNSDKQEMYVYKNYICIESWKIRICKVTWEILVDCVEGALKLREVVDREAIEGDEAQYYTAQRRRKKNGFSYMQTKIG